MGGEDGAVQHAAAPRAQRNPGIADDPDEDRDVASDVLADRLLGKVAAQADAATDVVKSAGKRALFTPYWNSPTCADKNGPYVAWVWDHISAAVMTRSDYVMPSFYCYECDGPEPSYAELDGIVATFADLFPNAQIGIGEFGKQGDAAILAHYLNYRNANPRFILGGLYWYGAQDLVPKSQPLWSVFSALMR